MIEKPVKVLEVVLIALPLLDELLWKACKHDLDVFTETPEHRVGAAGNIQALAQRRKVIHSIVTTETDRKRIVGQACLLRPAILRRRSEGLYFDKCQNQGALLRPFERLPSAQVA